MSIRKRMTISIVGALLVLLGAAASLLYVYLRGELTKQFDEVSLAKARTLGSLLRQSASGKVEFDFSDNAMPEFDRSKSPEYFELWKSGATIERSQSLEPVDLKLPPLESNVPWFEDVVLPDGRSGRIAAVQIVPSSENHNDENPPKPGKNAAARPAANFVLAVGRERVNLDHTLATIAATGAGGVVVLGIAFGLLVPWLIGRNLKPLAGLALQAGQIDAGALGKRFPVQTMPTELKPICGRLNDSLDRLQAAFVRERRFSADVAHELRTPIAELRLMAELGVKFGSQGEAAARSFRDALDVAVQMEMIVETLLEMMASDAALPAEALEPVDVAQMAQQAWRPLEEMAAKKKITLNRGLFEGTMVQTNPTILRRMFSNLLANAVEYSPPGTTIDLGLELHDQRLVVLVTNQAENLEAADVPHMSEPFWRKDASRTGSRHAGLGLALVACYARRLNMRVEWSLVRPGAFQARLEFPR